MKNGDSKYFVVRLTLGHIKSYMTSKEEIKNSDFGIKITQTDCNALNTRFTYQIELFYNNKFQDLFINDCQISYLVGSKRELGYYNSDTTRYKIEWISPEGKLCYFEQATGINIILEQIIYSIIFIIEIKNDEKVNTYWNYIFNHYPLIELGKSISLLKEIEPIIKSLKEKYPFLKNKINEGVDYRIKDIKSELEKMYLLQ